MMAKPDSQRPGYVSCDRKAPSPLHLDGPGGPFAPVASMRRSSTAVVVSLSGDPRLGPLGAGGTNLGQAVERLLRLLASRGVTLCGCGSCARFRFSAMSYQMSGGERGYCTVKGIAHTGPGDAVFLLDRCEGFQPRPSTRSWWDEEDE